MAYTKLSRAITLEGLEGRTLLAWGAAPRLIDQDDAAAAFPNITGQGVTVAVMDTGIDYSHPALGGGFGPGFKVKAGFDFVDNDSDPIDTFGHGTNIAGLIAAEPFTVGGDQYQGVAPDASLVALRVSSGGDVVTSQTIERALQWIEANYQTYGISIVNFSFGAGTYAGLQTDPVVSDDFKTLKDLGILFVSPSGNGGTSGGEGINWPAADPSVVAVGSVGIDDSISDFTQRGSNLDLLAPGESVGSTSKGGLYGLLTLSSYSSPIVAGAAALLKQADPTLHADDIVSILRASGVRRDDSSFGSLQSYPRIDLDNAITLALQRAPDAASAVGTHGAANDLAYDAQGVLHFAYYDQIAHTIKYATRSAQGAWSATRIVDSSGDDVGATLSLALDSLGKPSIAYYDGTVGDLEFARLDGAKWKRSTVDSKKVVGQFPSLAFDSNGQPIVAYYRKTSGDLRVMRFSGSGWMRTEVQTTDNVGQFDSLSVSEDGTIGVAYADTTNGALKYAQWLGAAWDVQGVDDLQGTAAFISLAFDGNNRPAVSYYDAFPADLKFATRASGSWQAQTIASKGAQGLYTNLWFDDNSAANILYFSRKSNAVYRLHGSLGSWASDTVKLTGGSQATAVATADGSAAAYAYFDSVKQKLLTGDLL